MSDTKNTQSTLTVEECAKLVTDLRAVLELNGYKVAAAALNRTLTALGGKAGKTKAPSAAAPRAS